jgi:ATP-dependent protease ClpP protease subunit
MKDLHIFIYNEIGFLGVTPEQVQMQLSQNPEAEHIIVHISSPGGGVFDGWTIGNILRASGKKLTARIEGLCASIATYIALSCDSIQISEEARFMIHNPMMGLEGEEKDLLNAADQLKTIKADLIKAYRRKTGLAEEELSKMMDAETWFTPSEAREKRFVDEVIPALKAVAKFDFKPEIKMQTTVEKKEVEGLFDRIMSKLNTMQKDLFSPKNIFIEMADGKKIFVESEDGELEGKKAFLTDAEGNRTETPAPAGNHDLIDGRVITVDATGTITAVMEEMADKAKEEMQQRITELENQLATASAENETLTNRLGEAETTMQEIVKEVSNLKKMTVGGSFKPAKAFHKPADRGAKTEPDQPQNGMAAWGKKLALERGLIDN